MEKGIIFESREFDVYQHMAADEILCSLPEKYMLRFFNWQGFGITYGYSQRAAQVEQAVKNAGKNINCITRRPTGGGMVFHEDDITFSFIFPSPELMFEPNKTYEKLHSAINKKYAECGEIFSLMSEKTKSYAVNSPAMACFSKPVNLDILYNGTKVLGGALRKFGSRMLYQGSFQAPKARERKNFHQMVISNALAEAFNIKWEVKNFTSHMTNAAEKLAKEKYSTQAWNFRI